VTRFLLDIASYQGSLTAADVVRAGFTAVNLKISHGLSRKAVHPDITGWVAGARDNALGISTFHWLDGSASGAAQAGYAWDRLGALGLRDGTAHVVDCESDATEKILREYLAAMKAYLGRPVMVYSAQWWWRPKGWNVADLTPYVHAAPDKGEGTFYPGAYPGDASPLWNTAGWGGWHNLAVMQYAVAPLTFPDRTAGTIDVSKSAIRTDGVWMALTGGEART
jgi:hypothetical protein